MSALGHHLLLGIAVVALAGAGVRLSSPFAHAGLERVIAAAAFACAIAAGEAVLLGFMSLAGKPLVLTGAAVATWAAVRISVTEPVLSVGAEFVDWLSSASATARAVVVGLGGGAIGFAAGSLDEPLVGVDGIYYHLPEVTHWVHTGTTGSVETHNYLYNVGDYPLVNEVLLAWAAGISHSMVALSVWPAACMLLLVAAGWSGLRSARVRVVPRALAVAAVCAVPANVVQLVGPLNDLPGLAWLVCAAALGTGAAAGRPRLLVPMLIAAGLAAGTKTTAVPALMGVLAATLWTCRGHLRPLGPPLWAAAGLAGFIGGFWYLRDLVTHGSPFWPWAAAPWGDPMPEFLQRTYPSLIERPRATLQGRLDDYAAFLGGGALLLGAGLVTPLFARRRAVVGLGGGVACLLALFAVAPSTAITDNAVFDGSISQTRYLLPTIAVATTAVALAVRDGGHLLATLGIAVLAAAAAWSLAQLLTGDFPPAPAAWVVVTGVAAGAAAGLIASWVSVAPPERAVPAAAVALFAALAAPAGGYVERHGRASIDFDRGLVRFFAGRQDFRENGAKIAMGPALAGTLAGDRLQHDVVLVGASEPCERVAARLREGWVVLASDPLLRSEVGYTAGDCLRDRRPLATIGRWRVYQPARAR